MFDVVLEAPDAGQGLVRLLCSTFGLGQGGAQVELTGFEFALKDGDVGDERMDMGLDLLAGLRRDVAGQSPREGLGGQEIVIELAVGPYEAADGVAESLDRGAVVIELNVDPVAGNRVARMVCGPRAEAERLFGPGHAWAPLRRGPNPYPRSPKIKNFMKSSIQKDKNPEKQRPKR